MLYTELEQMIFPSMQAMLNTSPFRPHQRYFGMHSSKNLWLCTQNTQCRALEIWLATTTLGTGQTAIKLVPFRGIHTVTTPPFQNHLRAIFFLLDSTLEMTSR